MTNYNSPGDTLHLITLPSGVTLHLITHSLGDTLNLITLPPGVTLHLITHSPGDTLNLITLPPGDTLHLITHPPRPIFLALEKFGSLRKFKLKFKWFK